MANLNTIELRSFVPARDFGLSIQFYSDMGFDLGWKDNDLAYFHRAPAAFLLQNFYVKELAENYMLQLLVEDVDAWHERLTRAALVEKYHARMSPVELRPWGQRDFTLHDPTGVLWRIGQKAS